jgi:hypothetical protein
MERRRAEFLLKGSAPRKYMTRLQVVDDLLRAQVQARVAQAGVGLRVNHTPRGYRQEQDIVINLTQGDLLEQDDAGAIVDTVNCVAGTGKGIALQFRNNWPANFATRDHGCGSSKVEFICVDSVDLVAQVRRPRSRSIAFSPQPPTPQFRLPPRAPATGRFSAGASIHAPCSPVSWAVQNIE